jgi:hypothetical protein
VEHPEGYGTPWDSCNRLEPGEDGGCWLNPNHQQHLKYGWVTADDLRDWLNGVPGKIIMSEEHWNELLYICSGRGWSVGYDIECFNMHPPKYLLAPGQIFHPIGGEQEVGTGFPKRMQLPKSKDGWERQKLSPEMIKVVEGHVKWLILQDFEKQISNSYGKLNPNTVRLSRECSDEIYGFMHALRALGLETYPMGASNTPPVRENFAWWKTILETESRWELFRKNGMAYEPWLKNKQSLYSHSPAERN